MTKIELNQTVGISNNNIFKKAKLFNSIKFLRKIKLVLWIHYKKAQKVYAHMQWSVEVEGCQ